MKETSQIRELIANKLGVPKEYLDESPLYMYVAACEEIMRKQERYMKDIFEASFVSTPAFVLPTPLEVILKSVEEKEKE